MLKLYLATVITYIIIINCAIRIFYDLINKNGWFSTEKKGIDFTVLVCISAIPIFRIIFLMTIFIMSTHTREEVEEWNEKDKHD